MRLAVMLAPASIRSFLWDNASLRRSDFVACRADRPEGEAPALQIIPETSLRAFFEGRGFAAQVRENFAGEMKRARDQNRIWLRACKRQRIVSARSAGVMPDNTFPSASGAAARSLRIFGRRTDSAIGANAAHMRRKSLSERTAS